MLELESELDKEEVVHNQNQKWKKPSIISCLVSLITVLFTQFTLSLLPLFLASSSFIALLPLSALLIVIVLILGRFCKRVAGVRASAPAFVFFTIFFIWAIFIYVVRQVISPLLDIVFNIEIIMVIIGLCRIMSSDPGFVTHHSSSPDLLVHSPLHDVEAQGEDFTRHRRVRYCRHCKNYVMGFDHHCPAFGNCIGQRNHALFTVLLVGFAISEASYVASASQFTAKSYTSTEIGGEATAARNLVVGTMLFCLIQVLWQVFFIIWHVYCACFNIKTDEWINWKKYPEFHTEGQPQAGIEFMNPYDKGILTNLKEFVSAKG